VLWYNSLSSDFRATISRTGCWGRYLGITMRMYWRKLHNEGFYNLYSPNIVGRDSSVGIATRYEPDCPGIEFRWGRDFPQPSRPALGVKRPGRGVDHPPSSSARVKERVELYLYSPSEPSWPVLGRTLPLPLHTKYYGQWTKENEMGGACGTYGGEKCVILVRNPEGKT
jgi:hypothetical protein